MTRAGADIYSFEVETIDGKKTSLADYRGKVLLIVNTASECGFTPQYKGLEEVWNKYRDRGFVVLGFPCNQFGAQEPGSNEQIAQFCELTFKTSFPMFAKIEVNGDDAHPLFKFLKTAEKGILGTEAIKWNFTKFLISRDGKVLKRYGSVTKPESITGEIEKLL